ncbi:hypothetical protein [Flavobacterium sp.]|uniref:hypothetical protein n=1 Tax=Flavobacterium sp. TaxID=239 RepID=UPI0039E52D48
MKLKLPITIFVLLMLTSCNKSIYGIYNTEHSKDRSALFQIKLNPNYTVEKNEIHTIRIDSKGTWKKENGKVTCYFQPTETGFSADTLILKIIGKKMFLEKNGIVYSKSFYLKKVK